MLQVEAPVKVNTHTHTHRYMMHIFAQTYNTYMDKIYINIQTYNIQTDIQHTHERHKYPHKYMHKIEINKEK